MWATAAAAGVFAACNHTSTLAQYCMVAWTCAAAACCAIIATISFNPAAVAITVTTTAAATALTITVIATAAAAAITVPLHALLVPACSYPVCCRLPLLCACEGKQAVIVIQVTTVAAASTVC
jgi:hypothetical protein